MRWGGAGGGKAPWASTRQRPGVGGPATCTPSGPSHPAAGSSGRIQYRVDSTSYEGRIQYTVYRIGTYIIHSIQYTV